MVKNKISAASWILRAGLAFVLVYAAIGGLLHPTHWIGYLPQVATDHFNADALLKIFDIYELLLAGWLIAGWRLKYAAGLMTLTMIGAIVSDAAAFETTFRDVAIACAAAALAVLDD